VESVLTTCPFCACGCAVYLQVQGGRPVGAAPSEHHPVSRGKLCARGWNAHEAIAWAERLTVPLVRRGSSLEPTTWPDALEQARMGLSTLLERGQILGVLGSARATNEENYMAARLARGGLHTGHIDSCLRAAYQATVDGAASVGGRAVSGTLADVEASNAVVLLEGDLAATHPQVAHAVIRAVKGGAKLVTVGCTRTQLARLGALHFPSLPGERMGVIAGLVAAVKQERASASTAEVPTGSVTGIALTETLRQAAGWLVGARRASILIAADGSSPERAAMEGAAIATLAAAMDHPGGGSSVCLILPARGNLRGACEMGVRPERLPGALDLADAVARERMARAWGHSPALAVGLPAEAMVGAVSGLVVVAEDLPAVLAAGSRALDAVAGIECIVVLDAFATTTARAAHVVLPIASFAETEGTVTNLEGRVQRMRPATSPPGEARPGWQVLGELSAALGLPLPYRSAADVLREVASIVPAYAGVSDRVLDETWGTFTAPPSDGGGAGPRTLDTGRAAVAAPAVLALDGVFDWGSDPLVTFSPTLRRDHVSRHKLYPRGLVQISQADADRLGVRQGWPVRVASANGEAVLPVVPSHELEPGVLLVPFAFREHVAGVLGGCREAAVKVEKVG
jgi:formate dehydrogenase alpha subunit